MWYLEARIAISSRQNKCMPEQILKEENSSEQIVFHCDGEVKCLFNWNSRDISGFGDAPAYQYFNMIHLYEQNITKRATMISTFCFCTPETFQSLSNTEQLQNSQSGTLFTLLV